MTHILAEHRTEITVSERTLYRYIDGGEFSIAILILGERLVTDPEERKKSLPKAFSTNNSAKIAPMRISLATWPPILKQHM